MVKRILLTLIILTLVLSHSGVATEFSKVGTMGAQFLKIGVGARYVGMGEASVACVNDAYAMYWNPASLTQLTTNNLHFTSVDWIDDVQLNYVAFGKPWGSSSAWGISVTVLTMGDMEVTTVQEPEGTGEKFSASDYSIALGYARKLTDRFSLGLSFKYLWERISEESASGFAFDFGTLFFTGIRNLRVGMNISNLGPEMKLDGPELDVFYTPYPENSNYDRVKSKLAVEPYDLPLTFRVGLAYDLYPSADSRLTLSSEAKHPNDNLQQVSVGGEWIWKEMVSLRTGYKLNYEEEGLTLGGGLKLKTGERTTLELNYAWADFNRLTSVHRFSVGFVF
ncbi:MAG: PorV/PorQ family protein [Candidatus Zixiibacteriota bacterium]